MYREWVGSSMYLSSATSTSQPSMIEANWASMPPARRATYPPAANNPAARNERTKETTDMWFGITDVFTM